MKRFGRRAAIVATSVALVFAAAGTSLAAVRAARSEGGVAPPALALPAPGATGPGPAADASPGDTLEPTTGPPDVDGSIPVPAPGGLPPPGPGPAEPSAGLPPPNAPSSPPSTTAAGQEPSRATPRVSSGARITLPTLPPASGPTPTTMPSRPSSLACPGDGGKGALAHAGGDLRAVSFRLPWPDAGPIVLLPQTSAARPGVGAVTIVESSVGALALDHSSLTLPLPLPVQYTLAYGQQTAQGAIVFSPVVGVRVNLVKPACRDQRFTLYDVAGGASRDGSPLRIVGVAAPTASVTVDDGGGMAHFRSAVPGAHSVTLLTAYDTGDPGPVVSVTVSVF